MELYYKNLISKEAELEKLVDNLMLVVQGAEDLAEAAGTAIHWEKRQEITTRLEQLREHCRRLREQARTSALAVDKVLRQYPYSSAGFMLALGILSGVILQRYLRAGDPEGSAE